MTDTRDSFEKWFSRQGFVYNNLNRSHDQERYICTSTQCMWEAWQAALQAGAGDGRLTKPARVGCTSFNNGVNERLVIECAQRNYEYWKNPPDIDTEGLAKLFGAHPNTDKRDAARYRFLRDVNIQRHEGLQKAIEYGSDHLDAAIDNAQPTVK